MTRENLPPFQDQPSITEQLAHLQRIDIENQLRDVSKELGTISVSLARQEEWRISVGERIVTNAAKMDALTKDVAEIKDLASRYKGGLYAVLGLGAVLSGIGMFWDKLISKFH